jgi:hypothetical protein
MLLFATALGPTASMYCGCSKEKGSDFNGRFYDYCTDNSLVVAYRGWCGVSHGSSYWSKLMDGSVVVRVRDGSDCVLCASLMVILRSLCLSVGCGLSGGVTCQEVYGEFAFCNNSEVSEMFILVCYEFPAVNF